MTIAALILAAVVITLLTYLVFVVRAYFDSDRIEARRQKNELEDAKDDLQREVARAKESKRRK